MIAYSTLPARVAPQLYNMLACLALEMVIIIFWLASFSIMADYSAGWGYGTFDYVYGYNYYGWKRDAVIVKRSDKYYAAWQSGAAAAGLGGLELCVFCPSPFPFNTLYSTHSLAPHPAPDYKLLN